VRYPLLRPSPARSGGRSALRSSCSSRTPFRTVTPIEIADDATRTQGMRVSRAPRRAILATGVAIATKRWIRVCQRFRIFLVRQQSLSFGIRRHR
jgi:hypothetical protein